MTMQSLGLPDFTLADIFESDPLGQRSLFQSFLQGFSPGQQQQLSTLFEPTFNRYLGQIGQQVRQGEAPDLKFNQFLQGQFNPQRQLLRMPSLQRNAGPTIFRF